MAEQNYDIGTAISLGTNLRPENDKTLTRGTQNWLQAEMAREAKRAKQEQDRANQERILYGSLKGAGSDFPDIHAALQENFVTGMTKLREVISDPFSRAMVEGEVVSNAERLKKEDARRKAQLAKIPNTNLEMAAEYIRRGKVAEFINQNPDFADNLGLDEEGGYNFVPEKMLNTGDMLNSAIKRGATYMPLDVDSSKWQAYFENKKRNVGQLRASDIAIMASDLSRDRRFRESYYIQNRTNLRPIFDEEANRILSENPNMDKQQAVAMAKTKVVEDAVKEELFKRNNIQIKESKPKTFSINIGGGPANQVAPLNIELKTIGQANSSLYSDDITGKLHSSIKLNKIFQGQDYGIVATTDENASIPLNAKRKEATVKTVDGTQEYVYFTPTEVIVLTGADGKKQGYVIIDAQSQVGEPISRRMIIPLEGNMAVLASSMNEPYYQNADNLRKSMQALIDEQGFDYKVPPASSSVSVGKKTGTVNVSNQKGEEKSTNKKPSITADAYRKITSITERNKYIKNPDGTYSLK